MDLKTPKHRFINFMLVFSQQKSIILFLFCTLIGIIACERSLDPYDDEETVFSVYGALEMGKETNIIRVRNLLEPFRADSTFPFDANVTFTDLQTGTSTQLRDTIVNFEAGRTQNFILEEQLQPNSQYQLTVERSDGANTTSIATTPALTEVSYTPNDGIFCETPIDFYFDNAKESESIQMEIGVRYDGEDHWAVMDLVGDIEYDSQMGLHKVRMSPRNLLVEIFTPILPDNPYLNPYTLFPTVRCDELENNTFTIRYLHFGPEWKTGRPVEDGPIDPESEDIENGLGFLGAYRSDTFSFELSQAELE